MGWTINQLNLGANRQLIRVSKLTEGLFQPLTMAIEDKSTTLPMRVGFEVVMDLQAICYKLLEN